MKSILIGSVGLTVVIGLGVISINETVTKLESEVARLNLDVAVLKSEINELERFLQQETATRVSHGTVVTVGNNVIMSADTFAELMKSKEK